MENAHFHEDPYVHYWIVLDCMFTLLTLGYIQQTQKMMLNSETTKNIFTLGFVQGKIMKQIQMAKLKSYKHFMQKINEAKAANEDAKLESSTSDDEDDKEATIFNMKLKVGKAKRALMKKSKSVLPPKLQSSDKLQLNNQEEKEETTDGDNTEEFESSSSSSDNEDSSESNNNNLASTLNLDESMRMVESFEKTRNILVAQKEKEMIKENTMKDVLVIEQDYLKGEQLEISMDVYNIFIAANITKNCNPVELGFCLQKVILVFMVQILISIGFMWEYLTLDRFQPFNIMNTSLSLIASILLQ